MYLSPANGKVYHKGRNIAIIYSHSIRMFFNVPIDKSMLPINALFNKEYKRNK